MRTVETQAAAAKNAWRIVRIASTETKNRFLHALEKELQASQADILAANTKDLGENQKLSGAMRRRLELTPKTLGGIAASVHTVAELPDPVGTTVSQTKRADGLVIERVRTPIGVIASIFESRPNIIVDIAALCIKSGNVAIVRGGKEAGHSNTALLNVIHAALEVAGLPLDAIQQLEDRRHEAVAELVQMNQYVDLAIPRGGEALIKNVITHARVPVIQHMRGLCHAYIDEAADVEKAVSIVVNAKTSNPATCNSVETVLIHQSIAEKVAPKIIDELQKRGVEIHGCPRTCTYNSQCVPATDESWSTEYLDLKVSMKIVDSFEDAVQHIQTYSSGLTDSIVTENDDIAKRFLANIDSACVLVNASNRLVDGGEFGLGSEIGISTSRIHMRGPMGLADLTVPAYRVIGTGHIRG